MRFTFIYVPYLYKPHVYMPHMCVSMEARIGGRLP